VLIGKQLQELSDVSYKLPPIIYVDQISIPLASYPARIPSPWPGQGMERYEHGVRRCIAVWGAQNRRVRLHPDLSGRALRIFVRQ